jgi:hypothetical protein
VSSCTIGLLSSGVLNGATLSTNGSDTYLAGYSWRGWNVSLNSSAQVTYYKHSNNACAESPLGLAIQDFGGVANYLGFWTLGGFCKTAAYAVGTHTAPPIASTYIHEMTFEDNNRVNWAEFPIYALANQPVTVTFYGRLTATSLWTTRPNIGIYDPSKVWQSAPEILNASAVMASNTSWQTLTATYTPTYDRELRIRVQGVGGNGGGTGTEILYWFHKTTLGGGGLLINPGLSGGLR